MIIIPFRHYHIPAMSIQSAQADMAELVNYKYCKGLEDAGPAYTALNGQDVIACGGVAQMWHGRGYLWSLLSDKLNPRLFVSLHKAVKRFIDEQQFTRLELVVDSNHKEAHRWAQILGFRHEALMLKYAPSGRDCDLYVRIK